ncbi:hypothetical protein D3C72_1741580 [compost metagenome]
MLVATFALLHVLERHDDRVVAPVADVETARSNELTNVALVVEHIGRQDQQAVLEKHLIILARPHRPVLLHHVLDAPVMDVILIDHDTLDLMAIASNEQGQ